MNRGCIYGYRKNGEDKIARNYNKHEPNNLAFKMIKYWKKYTQQILCNIFDSIQIVCEFEQPSYTQLNECLPIIYPEKKSIHDFLEWEQELILEWDWELMLSDTLGELEFYHKGLKYMTYIITSTIHSCTYGYIINLDTNKLEFWGISPEYPEFASFEERYEPIPDIEFQPFTLLAEYDKSMSTNKILQDMEGRKKQ